MTAKPHIGPRGPQSEADARAILVEARQKLKELQAVADEAKRQAELALATGRSLTKQERKAINRAAAMARYVADCAHRAAWEPPTHKRRGATGWQFAWDNSQQPPERAPKPVAQGEAKADEVL